MELDQQVEILHDVVLRGAVMNMQMFGTVVPAVFMITPVGLEVIGIHGDLVSDRERTQGIIREHAKEVCAHGVAFVFDGWTVLSKEPLTIPISEHPDKREAIVAIFDVRGRKKRMFIAPYTRGTDGKVDHIGEWEEEIQNISGPSFLPSDVN